MQNKYNLEERTGKFGEMVIDLCKSIKRDHIVSPIISQLVRSATSVGANYMEANGASSRKDFRNKIFICKKEIRETNHWLRMLVRCRPEMRENVKAVVGESGELTLIFSKIGVSLDAKS